MYFILPFASKDVNLSTKSLIDVAVNFLSRVIFAFLLFLVIVVHANKVETKEK